MLRSFVGGEIEVSEQEDILICRSTAASIVIGVSGDRVRFLTF
jgi:hypothetical protein